MQELINNCQRFIGKICTIVTAPVSVPVNDAVQHSQFFTGKVTEVNSSGIWIQSLNTNTMAFYMFPIIGVAEEQFISKDDPEYNKIQEEFATPKPTPSQSFISIDELTKKVKNR